MIVGLA